MFTYAQGACQVGYFSVMFHICAIVLVQWWFARVLMVFIQVLPLDSHAPFDGDEISPGLLYGFGVQCLVLH